MKIVRRVSALLAAAVLSLGVAGVSAPAHAGDTSWDTLTGSNNGDTSWDTLAVSINTGDTSWDV